MVDYQICGSSLEQANTIFHASSTAKRFYMAYGAWCKLIVKKNFFVAGQELQKVCGASKKYSRTNERRKDTILVTWNQRFCVCYCKYILYFLSRPPIEYADMVRLSVVNMQPLHMGVQVCLSTCCNIKPAEHLFLL